MNFEKKIEQKFQVRGKLNDYLQVKNGLLYYENIKLMSLVEQYGSPLEVAYTDKINQRVKSLKRSFKDAIKKYKYPAKYLYAYATKANYYSEVVTTALNNIDCLETTSSYDMDIVDHLFKRKLIDKKLPIICNGFKKGSYFKKIIALKKKGLNILPILENTEEVDMFLTGTKLNFSVGMRINIDSEVAKSIERGGRVSSEIDSRFGLSFNEMKKSAEMIDQSKHLTYKIFHFHLGGTIKNTNQYIDFVGSLFENSYCKLKKNHKDLEFFDFGGGLPVQYRLDFHFDYDDFANKLVKKLLQISKKMSVDPPTIIGEHGRYTVNDHSFFLFKIDLVKQAKEKNTFWYLINSSLMNFLPDSWALGQDFIFLPLNGWRRPYVKARLGGMTCDPDDTYYKSEKDNFLYMPKISDEEDLYVGVFGVGAYQEIISGVGGVHHCLLPEGNELIIYKKNRKLYFDKISKLQSPAKVLKILDYHRHHRLTRYRNK